jgi:hypothetical protein
VWNLTGPAEQEPGSADRLRERTSRATLRNILTHQLSGHLHNNLSENIALYTDTLLIYRSSYILNAIIYITVKFDKEAQFLLKNL